MSVFIKYIRIKEKNKVLALLPIADDTCHFAIDARTKIDTIDSTNRNNRNRE